MKDQLHRYKSVEELFESIEEERRKHPIKDFFFTIKCNLIRLFWENSQDLCLAIKWFIQRGKRGFADCDIWQFDYYLSNLIEKGIKRLSEISHGIPNNLKDLDEWKDILEKIQRSFHIAKLIANGEWIYVSFDDWTEEKYKENKKTFNRHNVIVMDLETVIRYEEGLFLFKKYYYDLWD